MFIFEMCNVYEKQQTSKHICWKNNLYEIIKHVQKLYFIYENIYMKIYVMYDKVR